MTGQVLIEKLDIAVEGTYISLAEYDGLVSVMKEVAHRYIDVVHYNRPGFYVQPLPGGSWYFMRHSISHDAKVTKQFPPDHLLGDSQVGQVSEGLELTEEQQSKLTNAQLTTLTKSIEVKKAAIEERVIIRDIVQEHSPAVAALLQVEITELEDVTTKLESQLAEAQV